MKRWTILPSVLVALLITVAAYAGDLKVSETQIDYGNIKEGPPVIKKLVLTNTGSSVLAVANVTAS